MPSDANKINNVDTNLQTTAAVAAAAADTDHASIDLGGSGPHRDGMEIHIDVPAMPALVDDKTVIFTLEDSADDSAWAAADSAQTATVTGVNTPGADATTFRFPISSTCQRYVRVNQATLAAAGDNTGVTITCSLMVP